jgi:hypothetical protein
MSNWENRGGYGWNLKTDHAYVYKYIGKKPRPVKDRWKVVGRKGVKRINMCFKTEHEAIERAASFIFY